MRWNFIKFFLIFNLISFTQAALTASSTCKANLKRFSVYNSQNNLVGSALAREYQPEKNNSLKFGRMVILPPTRGETALEKTYARELCQLGYLSQIILSWPEIEYDFNDLRSHDATIYRIRDTFDSLIADDQRPVGVLGTSLGGIMTTSLIPFEPRIKAVVFIMSGVDIPYIISQTTQPLFEKQRAYRMQKYGLKTSKEYEMFMKSYISIEPKDLLRNTFSLPSSLHVVSEKDDMVPSNAQMELIKLFPNPEIIKVNSAHIPSIIRTNLFNKKKIFKFIDRNLD